MKKIQKTVAILSAVVFLCALLLGVNAVFSVEEIAVTFTLSSESGKREADAAQKSLEERYIGDVLFFVSEKRLVAYFAEYPYFTVKEFHKVYPNKIALSVEERTEAFAFEYTRSGKSVYCVTDAEGNVLCEKDVNENNVDKEPNFTVSGLRYTEEAGVTADVSYAAVLEICRTLHEKTGNVRTCFLSLELFTPTAKESDKYVVIHTREGVDLRIYNPLNLAAQKATAAVEKYLSLTDEEKTYGAVVSTDSAQNPSEQTTAYFRNRG